MLPSIIKNLLVHKKYSSKQTAHKWLSTVLPQCIPDTDRATFSTKVFLKEGFPLSLIHQAFNRVVKEGSVGQNVIIFSGQSHSQIGFLSGTSGM